MLLVVGEAPFDNSATKPLAFSTAARTSFSMFSIVRCNSSSAVLTTGTASSSSAAAASWSRAEDGWAGRSYIIFTQRAPSSGPWNIHLLYTVIGVCDIKAVSLFIGLPQRGRMDWYARGCCKRLFRLLLQPCCSNSFLAHKSKILNAFFS